MKLADVKHDDAVPFKPVKLKLANCPDIIELGVRLLTVTERAAILRAAKEAARLDGVEAWNNDDPVCILHLWTETIAVACVDIESDPMNREPFFADADQIRGHRLIGQKNIQYLYEQHETYEEEESIRPTQISTVEALTHAVRLAEGDSSPLDLMRLGMLRAFARTLASLLYSLPKDRLLSMLEDSSSTPTSKPSKSSASERSPSRKDPPDEPSPQGDGADEDGGRDADDSGAEDAPAET